MDLQTVIFEMLLALLLRAVGLIEFLLSVGDRAVDSVRSVF